MRKASAKKRPAVEEEERAFERGGGSGLAPVVRKQLEQVGATGWMQ